ncbi:MAG: fatty acid desaturase [Pirellulaceae bacterium]
MAQIDIPSSARPVHYYWHYIFSIVLVHAVACLAMASYFFSWTGVIAFVAGLYFFNTLGINLAYHRLLTHQGMIVPKWLEYVLVTLGVCCLQDSPARWVAIHRMHHQHSDEEDDPHSPLAGFLWSHFGWLFVRNRNHDVVIHYERYVRDLLRDPYYFLLEKNLIWMWIYVVQVAVYLIAGFGIGMLAFGDSPRALQFALSVTVWGVFVRTVVAWHITWAVNSASHVWGYQSYQTGDSSRNNWFVALVSNGEGWHNNHHADQRSAAHGHRWWEFDVTYITIWFLERVGLATKVIKPKAWKVSE